MPELLVKIYLTGVGVFLFLTVLFPEILYRKKNREKIQKALEESFLPDNFKAVAITTAVLIKTILWPWTLIQRFLFNSEEKK